MMDYDRKIKECNYLIEVLDALVASTPWYISGTILPEEVMDGVFALLNKYIDVLNHTKELKQFRDNVGAGSEKMVVDFINAVQDGKLTIQNAFGDENKWKLTL